MPKTILLSLSEANALAVHRMSQLVPGMGWVYDARPVMQFILQDIFSGKQTFEKVTCTDILEHDGLTLDQAEAFYHEVYNTVIDVVSAWMPHLTDVNQGYHFKVHNNFDLEITIPDYCLIQPETTRAAQFQLDVIEEIQETVDNGGYVSEHLRRFAGC